MNITIPNINITQKLIFEKVSQKELFQKYTNIYPEQNERYINPLRENKTPNTEFIEKDGVLYMRDYGSDIGGNIFEIIKFKFNCTYEEAKTIICNDFGIYTKSSSNNVSREERIINNNSLENIVRKKLHTIKIKKKEFTKKELEFWNCNNSFNFEGKYLEHFQIYSTENVWYNEKCVYSREGVFAYQLIPNIFQIYSPFQDDRRYRFRSTNLVDIIVGKHLLVKSKYVLVTKSYKDYFYAKQLGINAVAFLNEGIIPSQEQINYLSKFGEIIILFDKDEKGEKVVKKICEIYPQCSYIFLPEEYGKDITECIYNVGIKTVEEFFYESTILG